MLDKLNFHKVQLHTAHCLARTDNIRELSTNLGRVRHLHRTISNRPSERKKTKARVRKPDYEVAKAKKR